MNAVLWKAEIALSGLWNILTERGQLVATSITSAATADRIVALHNTELRRRQT